MTLKTISELRADFRGGAPGFRFVFVIAVFVVNVARFAVFVIAVFVVNVSFFAVRVVAVGAVNVSGFAVVVRATGAVDVSGFAVRRARRDFAAENEESGDASDEQERERADGDEGRRGFRLIVVVLQFGHFGILGLFDFKFIVAFLIVFKARSTVNREFCANGDKAASKTLRINDLTTRRWEADKRRSTENRRTLGRKTRRNRRKFPFRSGGEASTKGRRNAT